MNTVFIYALNEPDTGCTRYIGKATDPYIRYEWHLNSREKSRKAKWVRELQSRGAFPILEVLDEVPETEWEFWEREYIQLYRALGIGLLNVSDGGIGGRTFTAEVSAAKSASMRGEKNFNFGRNFSAETREKLSAAKRGRILSAEHRSKISIANQGKRFSKEHRIKIGLARAAAYRRAK